MTAKPRTPQHQDMDMSFMHICSPAEIYLANRQSTYISLNLHIERELNPALDRCMESLVSEGAL